MNTPKDTCHEVNKLQEALRPDSFTGPKVKWKIIYDFAYICYI